jgi:hypothetical protein
MNITPAPSCNFNILSAKKDWFSRWRNFNSQIVDDKVPFIVNTSPDGQPGIVPSGFRGMLFIQVPPNSWPLVSFVEHASFPLTTNLRICQTPD